MRKTISLMIAAVILLSMGFSSAAAEPVASKSGTVQAGYVAGEAGGQIISVDINWKNMEFTYHDASKAVWDPVNHVYSEAKEAAWEHSEAYISITNHSNAILQANIAYTSNEKYKDMSLLFTDENPYIGSAYTSQSAGEECNVTIRAIPNGTLIPDTPSGTDVGEIKVTVVPVDSQGLALDMIGSGYEGHPVHYTGLKRQVVCYGSQTDFDTVESCYKAAKKVIVDQPGEEYEMNAALNSLIVAYYNNLYFAQ